MQELIREIRTRLQYSQEQLASALGVSSVTVSRWENGKAKPGALAGQQLFELCRKHSLDMSEYIVDREKMNGEEPVLYHASRKGIEGSIQPVSRSRCDFGRGFYMGTDPLQPLTLVCNENAPKFYTLFFDMSDLKILDVEIDIDWAMLIAYYRGYMDDWKESPLYERYAHMADGYDVITGLIADDRMYQVLTDFFEQRITDTALIQSLSALKLGKQYAAITRKACDKVIIKKEKTFSNLELMILKEKSIIRRKEGISLADGIVKAHRRDGRYFDEILRGNAL